MPRTDHRCERYRAPWCFPYPLVWWVSFSAFTMMGDKLKNKECWGSTVWPCERRSDMWAEIGKEPYPEGKSNPGKGSSGWQALRLVRAGCTPRTQRSWAEGSCTGWCEMSWRNGWETYLVQTYWIIICILIRSQAIHMYMYMWFKTRPCRTFQILKRSLKPFLPLSQDQYQMFIPLGSCPDFHKPLGLYPCRWQKCTWAQLLDRRLLEMRDYI